MVDVVARSCAKNLGAQTGLAEAAEQQMRAAIPQ